MESTILDSDLEITMDDVADATKPRDPFPQGTFVRVTVTEAGDEHNGTTVRGPKALYLPYVLEATNADGDVRTVFEKQSLYPISDPSDKRKAVFKRMFARFAVGLGISDPAAISALYSSLVRQEAGAAQQLVGATGNCELKIEVLNNGKRVNKVERWVLPNGAVA